MDPETGDWGLDANVLIYHFAGISPECCHLLQRCEAKTIEAFTGTHIILEVLHRLMIIEALNKERRGVLHCPPTNSSSPKDTSSPSAK